MKTFKEAYAVLSKNAQTLRNQQEPNIDDLLNIVNQSVAAYKVCKERIDAVEAALEEALKDPAVASTAAQDDSEIADRAPSGSAQSQAPKSGFDDMDDDIPF